jgi:hypothetical protein
MNANSRKKPSQLEINDLIAEAVVNAEARRNQAEDFLSDEQAAAVKGGGRPIERFITGFITEGFLSRE